MLTYGSTDEGCRRREGVTMALQEGPGSIRAPNSGKQLAMTVRWSVGCEKELTLLAWMVATGPRCSPEPLMEHSPVGFSPPGSVPCCEDD